LDGAPTFNHDKPSRRGEAPGFTMKSKIIQSAPPKESRMVERCPLVSVKASGVMIRRMKRLFQPRETKSIALSQKCSTKPMTMTPKEPAAATPSPEKRLAFAFMPVV